MRRWPSARSISAALVRNSGERRIATSASSHDLSSLAARSGGASIGSETSGWTNGGGGGVSASGDGDGDGFVGGCGLTGGDDGRWSPCACAADTVYSEQ